MTWWETDLAAAWPLTALDEFISGYALSLNATVQHCIIAIHNEFHYLGRLCRATFGSI